MSQAKDNQMEVEKIGKKWVVKGNGEGWVFDKTFRAKWKAEVALEVFGRGGRVSDYWKQIREKRPARVVPQHALRSVAKSLEEINRLNPTCDEIVEFAKRGIHGTVTSAESQEYWSPSLHDTWGMKEGGRVHIDLGCCGYHLMLDRYWAMDFIRFINDRRNRGTEIERI